MAFGLKMRGLDRPGDRGGAWRTRPRFLGLTEVLEKRPRHLSGGQRQRVAMGRAIVREPQAFLMDEPLSNLDAKLRVQMRAEIARIQRDLRVTTIYVTHDQSEAMTLGDRVCVMRGGLLQQVDRPQVLYDRPGEPLRCRLHRLAGDEPRRGGARERTARSASARTSSPSPRPCSRRGRSSGPTPGAAIALGIRPEDIRAAGGGAPIEITVDIKEDMGAEVYLHFAVDAPPLKSDDLREILGDRGARGRRGADASPRQPVHRARRARHERPRGGEDSAARRHDAPALLRSRDAAPGSTRTRPRRESRCRVGERGRKRRSPEVSALGERQEPKLVGQAETAELVREGDGPASPDAPMISAG